MESSHKGNKNINIHCRETSDLSLHIDNKKKNTIKELIEQPDEI